ncbi:MAG TPA: class I SAM-dependent methyltransferase, partial [Ferruginibacter sp.]|nr:class I SAM-dependent methyltransferase [Ferruginibacter sp.]
MIHYSCCPVCQSSQIQPKLTARDYTVSRQSFVIWYCSDCTLCFTQDIPDQDSIGVFYASSDYISHSDTKEGIINRLYHLVRKRTLASKKRLVVSATRTNSGNVLDIGCGTGAFLYAMKAAGWTITGLEPDPSARAKAMELYAVNPQEPGRLFELPAASYAAITMWHVLEHVHELHAYMKRIGELLAPGGKLFIAVPNYTSADANAYKEYWAAWDVPRHLYHFSPGSMERLLSLHGMKLESVRPMWFD